MINDDEFLNKIINGEDITCEYLGIHPNLAKCSTIIECGFRIFYSDGINYYDVYGNFVREKDIRRYKLEPEQQITAVKRLKSNYY